MAVRARVAGSMAGEAGIARPTEGGSESPASSEGDEGVTVPSSPLAGGGRGGGGTESRAPSMGVALAGSRPDIGTTKAGAPEGRRWMYRWSPPSRVRPG
ncbi:hypothetical protein ZWY2020_039654 [Hordeum vulgare]|nr:hypothetical protein ZWY2020_039654 [Hordeum vulgare]